MAKNEMAGKVRISSCQERELLELARDLGIKIYNRNDGDLYIAWGKVYHLLKAMDQRHFQIDLTLHGGETYVRQHFKNQKLNFSEHD